MPHEWTMDLHEMDKQCTYIPSVSSALSVVQRSAGSLLRASTRHLEQELLDLHVSAHQPFDAVAEMYLVEVDEQSCALVAESQVGQKLRFVNWQ